MAPAPSPGVRVVSNLWHAMAKLEWDLAAQFLHPDVIVEWPQSKERIRGRGNFIDLNRNYPGNWEIHVEDVEAVGDRVVARVRIPVDGRTEYCVGFYKVADGQVVRATEWWAEAYPAPAWRRAWVEPL